MQRLNLPICHPRRSAELRSFCGLIVLFLTGCSGASGTSQTARNPGEFQEVHLTFACPDVRLRGLLEPMTRVWTHRTGAVVTIVPDAMNSEDATDLAIIPYHALGEWAERDQLLPIPATMREPGHPFQFSSVLEVYRSETYAGWGSQLLGLPIAVEGSALVYRADRFNEPAVQMDYQRRFGRRLAAPASWEEFANIARFFSDRDGRPSLPRVSGEPAQLELLFLRVASCFDRSMQAGEGFGSPDSIAFFFRLDSGKARVQTAGFVEAARWLRDLQVNKCFPNDGATDAPASLNDGRAVLGIVSLADIMELDREHRRIGRYGFAPIPGSKAAVNPATGALTPTPLNSVPFFTGGHLGVVRRGCKHPGAAFALLAELAGPARSQEIIAAGGYGPTRESHLESDRLPLWLGYGLDPEGTRLLQNVMRANLGKSVRNPAFGLRTPDRDRLYRELNIELIRIVDGSVSPTDGLLRLAAEWDRDRTNTPAARRLEWRRRSAGLN